MGIMNEGHRMVFNPGKNNVCMGSLFEEVFKTILDSNGFIEGKDYIKATPPNPDFYFNKSKTYVEVKLRGHSPMSYSKEQERRFKELLIAGYKIKMLCFEIKISEPFKEEISLYNLLKNLEEVKTKCK